MRWAADMLLMKTMQNRVREIDYLKCVFIILMVISFIQTRINARSEKEM